MDRASARRLIRERAGQMAPIPHAVERMIERRIDRQSVKRCLERGTLVEGPARDIASQQWRCTIEAQLDGVLWRIVVEIPEDGLLVITVIDVRRAKPRRR